MSEIIDNFIKRALEEDIGHGDITSMACIDEKHIGKAKLIVKEPCKIAGIDIAKKIYSLYDHQIQFNPFFQDGDNVEVNNVIFEVSGSQRSILATERLILNCMQRMSGIATKTQQFIHKVKDLDVTILDTRKTSPSIRFLEKEAVKIGGGTNHRSGLYDAIMIKDNHVDFSGSIENAITNCNNFLKKTNLNDTQIIIEVRSLEELKLILSIGRFTRILLDNFSVENTKKAVAIVKKKYPLESSGNINLENVRDYALCGVDYISIGSLTHSIKSIDLSMLCI